MLLHEKHRRELVRSDAPGDVVTAQLGADDVGEGPQRAVADASAVALVELGEVDEVPAQQRQRGPMPCRPRELLREAGVEVVAQQQPRQRIARDRRRQALRGQPERHGLAQLRGVPRQLELPALNEPRRFAGADRERADLLSAAVEQRQRRDGLHSHGHVRAARVHDRERRGRVQLVEPRQQLASSAVLDPRDLLRRGAGDRRSVEAARTDDDHVELEEVREHAREPAPGRPRVDEIVDVLGERDLETGPAIGPGADGPGVLLACRLFRDACVRLQQRAQPLAHVLGLAQRGDVDHGAVKGGPPVLHVVGDADRLTQPQRAPVGGANAVFDGAAARAHRPSARAKDLAIVRKDDAIEEVGFLEPALERIAEELLGAAGDERQVQRERVRFPQDAVGDLDEVAETPSWSASHSSDTAVAVRWRAVHPHRR